ncbi:AmmeMemoRadiSam system protein A [Pseudomonadota bacterium]
MNSMNSYQGELMLKIARSAIAEKLGCPHTTPGTNSETWLDDPAATFVTLKEDGELRGCIGSLKAHCSLYRDLCNNAVSAAFHDPRFPPVTKDEFEKIHIEVSLLTEPEQISFNDQNDLLSQLAPGVDGIIFECGSYRSTFLPQVWEQLPTPELFMAHLKQKAGLTADFWSSEVLLYRYRVEKFSE